METQLSAADNLNNFNNLKLSNIEYSKVGCEAKRVNYFTKSSESGGEQTPAIETDGERACTVDATKDTEEKRTQYIVDDSVTSVLYITGSHALNPKLEPNTLRGKLVHKIGEVENIYISGGSLKVYCMNSAEKFDLLRHTQLNDINMRCPEPIADVRCDVTLDLEQPKTRGDCTTMGIKFPQLVKYEMAPTNSAVLVFNGESLSEHVTLVTSQ